MRDRILWVVPLSILCLLAVPIKGDTQTASSEAPMMPSPIQNSECSFFPNAASDPSDLSVSLGSGDAMNVPAGAETYASGAGVTYPSQNGGQAHYWRILGEKTWTSTDGCHWELSEPE